jgi:hypothetical protein
VIAEVATVLLLLWPAEPPSRAVARPGLTAEVSGGPDRYALQKGEHSMADTPIETVPGWSADLVARAKSSWVTTAEQVVAVGATTRGIRSLAEQLGVPEDRARELLESARMTLAPAKRAEMEKAVDTSEYGLGVLPPKGEDRK